MAGMREAWEVEVDGVRWRNRPSEAGEIEQCLQREKRNNGMHARKKKKEKRKPQTNANKSASRSMDYCSLKLLQTDVD